MWRVSFKERDEAEQFRRVTSNLDYARGRRVVVITDMRAAILRSGRNAR